MKFIKTTKTSIVQGIGDFINAWCTKKESSKYLHDS